MTAELLLEVIDGLAPEELFAQACQLGAATGWAFGHGSKDHDTGRFWKMDLDRIGVFDAIWIQAREHLKEQLLDSLNDSYSFTLPGGAVEREFQGIWRAAQAQGLSGEEAALELRAIAERRVRTGIVIAELARRREISGAAMEDRVADSLIAQANIVERDATAEEAAELG